LDRGGDLPHLLKPLRGGPDLADPLLVEVPHRPPPLDAGVDVAVGVDGDAGGAGAAVLVDGGRRGVVVASPGPPPYPAPHPPPRPTLSPTRPAPAPPRRRRAAAPPRGSARSRTALGRRRLSGSPQDRPGRPRRATLRGRTWPRSPPRSRQ